MVYKVFQFASVTNGASFSAPIPNPNVQTASNVNGNNIRLGKGFHPLS